MPLPSRALLAFGVAAIILLAGCSGSGGDASSTTTGSEPCPSAAVVHGSGGPTTLANGCDGCKPACSSTTSARPANLPPVLVVAASANVTLVGGNITVSANGTTDPDDGLAQIAVGVTTANRSLEPQFLYLSGAFRLARFNLTTAGPGNITVVAQDKAGATTVKVLPLFVNAASTVTNVGPLRLAVPSQAPAATPTACHGPTEQPAADGEMSFQGTFRVEAGATHVVATVTGGSANIALCAPDGTAVSGASTGSVTSTKGTAFSAQTGTSAYYVQAYSTAPNQAAGAVTVDVVVHYEPQP